MSWAGLDDGDAVTGQKKAQSSTVPNGSPWAKAAVRNEDSEEHSVCGYGVVAVGMEASAAASSS